MVEPECIKATVEEIIFLRLKKLRSLLFPSYGLKYEQQIYSGIPLVFRLEDKFIGYCVYRDDVIFDFYIDKEFVEFNNFCFDKAFDYIKPKTVLVRSDDNLLINLIFRYDVKLTTGNYLIVRDRRVKLPTLHKSSLYVLPMKEEFKEVVESTFYRNESYNLPIPSEKVLYSNVGKEFLKLLFLKDELIGIGMYQPVRNFCAEVYIAIKDKYRNKGFGTFLTAEMARDAEMAGYQCFGEVSKASLPSKKLGKKLGFYVIARYYTATLQSTYPRESKSKYLPYSLSGYLNILKDLEKSNGQTF